MAYFLPDPLYFLFYTFFLHFTEEEGENGIDLSSLNGNAWEGSKEKKENILVLNSGESGEKCIIIKIQLILFFYTHL